MFESVKTILFATNLSETCRQAFNFVAILATRLQATIVLLYVMEKVPKSAEGQLKAMIGDDRWNQLVASQEKDARQILMGKRSSVALIRQALKQFCTEAGIENGDCGYNSREIVISEGEVVDNIVSRAAEYNCDMIVLGTREGFLSHNSIGPTIKAVMRKSKVPVLVVPPKSQVRLGS